MSHRYLLPLLCAIIIVATPQPTASVALMAAGELAYLALGDSVASGAELGDAVSYPRRLGERLANETGRPLRYWNRARDGEQSGGVVAGQLDAISEFGPELVTLTVGANDFLVPTFECIATSIDSVPGINCRLPDPRTTLPALEANVRQILDRLTAETEATIAVTTYYNPFPPGSRCAPGLAEVSLRHLNAAIARAVARYPERAVLVDLLAVFRGHEGREPAGWFMRNRLGLACSDIHPSPDGQSAIADAVWDAVAGRVLSAER